MRQDLKNFINYNNGVNEFIHYVDAYKKYYKEESKNPLSKNPKIQAIWRMEELGELPFKLNNKFYHELSKNNALGGNLKPETIKMRFPSILMDIFDNLLNQKPLYS